MGSNIKLSGRSILFGADSGSLLHRPEKRDGSIDLARISGKKGGISQSGKDVATSSAVIEELEEANILLPPLFPFKRKQMSEKYPKGQSRGRHWKHLKQILQGENYHLYPPDEPNYMNIEAPPSMYPAKKYCDISGFEAPYTDPRTKLRYANVEIFKTVRSLPNEYVQGYLALRNAAVVLK